MTKIIGVPTYDTLHILHNDIKYNSIVVHYNFGGYQPGYLVLVVSPTDYALLSNALFVNPIQPVTIVIPTVTTHHAQDELKCQYDENLQNFHEMQRVERKLMQQLVLSIESNKFTAIRNRTTGKFTVPFSC